MKKTLLSFVLIIGMLLTFVACDIAQTPDEPVDDPAANLEAVVQSVNSGMTVGEMMSSGDMKATMDKLPEAVDEIKKNEFEGTAKFNGFGESADIYFGMKNGLLVMDNGDSKMYLFVEDDMKLVSVYGNGESYSGDVNDSLVDIFAMIGGAESDNNGGLDMVDPYSQAMEILKELKLPEIKPEDVTVEENRYVFSEEYMLKVINTFVDAFADVIVSAGTPDTQIQAIKDAAAEYLAAMHVKAYYNVKYGEIVGFGVSMAPEADLAAELFECSAITLTFDVNMGDLVLDVDFVADGESYSVDAKIDSTMDDEGDVAAIVFDVDAILPVDDYDYSADQMVDLKGKMNISVDAKFDFTKLESDGELAKIDISYTAGNFKAYVIDVNTWESVYSAELTKNYADRKQELTVSAKCDTANNGESLTVAVNGKTNVDGAGEFTASGNVNKGTKNYPAIPAGVYTARQEALDKYDNFDFEFDYDDFEDIFGDETIDFEDFEDYFEDESFNFDFDDIFGE